jgi:hypothetical protein
MSAIASFHILPKQYLPQLLEDAFVTTSSHGRAPAEDYGWSGYCIVHVVTYLGDLGIDLFDTPYEVEANQLNEDGFTLLLTTEHQRYLPQLNPAEHSEALIAAHFATEDYAFEESGQAGRTAIELLRDQLASLTEDEILVVQVG